MKTSEFKEAVEELGFKLEKTDNEIESELNISLTSSNETLASISLKTRYDIFIYFEDCPNLINEEEQKKLFYLSVAYASTPIAEREEEKRYLLKIEENLMNEKLYIYYDTDFNRYRHIVESNLNTKMGGVKTVFTESELESMDLTGFEKVEVME